MKKREGSSVPFYISNFCHLPHFLFNFSLFFPCLTLRTKEKCFGWKFGATVEDLGSWWQSKWFLEFWPPQPAKKIEVN